MSVVARHLSARFAAPAAALLGVACVPEQPRSADAETLQALELLEALEQEDHRAWPRPEPWTARAEASGSHGRFIEVFANPRAAAVLDAGEVLGAWPEGSRFVAEGYEDADARDPFVLSLLFKESGVWTWAQYEGDEPVAYGRPTACIGCHLAGSDLVRSVSLPEEEED